jgi:hypothetical protein
MNHHVYFWLKEEHKNPSDRAIFEKQVAALFEIRWVTGGRWSVPADVPLRPVVDQSWDYALAMEFANIEGHNAYQVDLDHEEFVQNYKHWWDKVIIHDLA